MQVEGGSSFTDFQLLDRLLHKQVTKQAGKERWDKRNIKCIPFWILRAALSVKGLQKNFQLKFTESLIEVIIKLLLAKKKSEQQYLDSVRSHVFFSVNT